MKYFIRVRSRHWAEDDYCSPDCGPLPSLEVPEHKATCTGLADCNGEDIMRAPSPMGFGKNEEWDL